MAALYEDALVYETGTAITSTGALTAYSGAKTGRSPLDKRIVQEASSENDVWWGPVNKAMTPEVSLSHGIRPKVEMVHVSQRPLDVLGLGYLAPHYYRCVVRGWSLPLSLSFAEPHLAPLGPTCRHM